MLPSFFQKPGLVVPVQRFGSERLLRRLERHNEEEPFRPRRLHQLHGGHLRIGLPPAHHMVSPLAQAVAGTRENRQSNHSPDLPGKLSQQQQQQQQQHQPDSPDHICDWVRAPGDAV